MNSNFWNSLKTFFAGLVVGVANIIPGVSGGTMAVVLNIYDELISSISNIRSKFKKSIKFLLIFGVGALIAILACSTGVTFLLENYALITNFAFIGVIVGSSPMIYKRATKDGFKPMHLIPCVITFLVMIAMIVLPYDDSSVEVQRTIDVVSFVKFMLMGIVASVCMLVPGISGSFVLLLMGQYQSITTAISEVNFAILLPFLIGGFVGLVAGAKFIEFLIKRYPQATYFSILGFVFGSVPVILDKIVSGGNMVFDYSFVIAILFLFFGAVVSLFFDSNLMQNIVNGKGKE